jgi:hypothetical protein
MNKLLPSIRIAGPAVLERRVISAINYLLHIEVDACGVPDEQLALIAGKIRQAPCIVNAYWHRLDCRRGRLTFGMTGTHA